MPTCTKIILIAEDDLDDQELIAFAFSKADPTLELRMVRDGMEAVEYLENSNEQNLPCLILLDYNMPELNGAQVIQRLMPNERYSSIPKVILSTSNNPLFVNECLQKGALDYKVKPTNFAELVHIAKEMASLCNRAA
ncbi:response regulator [Aridibaculum aurantiacum]|uniref:response regulator n=1 Tax=Aridibaculum aurantiacum TaxID=2810307 RepID=UPI001A972687|nr:response regulator [Aridibaculum aurantiacum]